MSASGRAQPSSSGYPERSAFYHRGGSDWESTWQRLRRAIDAGDPVMVFTDIYYLDYYETDTHFAPHSLLVVGYEGTGEDATVLLGDSEFEALRAAVS